MVFVLISTHPVLEGKIMSLLLATLSIVSAAFAGQPGFLKDFNYQVVQLKSIEQAEFLENSLTTQTRTTSICANRAHYWSYELSKFQHVQTGKVFIFFTAKGEANENGDWAYHVAPYVVVDGEEVVLDPAFSVFNGKPVAMDDWTQYFGKSSQCIVLDPAHNPEHLKLEINNVGSDDKTPLSENTGNARQYPSTEGTCYIRKVPMYYQWPSEVYGVDLYRAGNLDFKKFNYQGFDGQNVLSACKQAVRWDIQLGHSCSDYLGIKEKPGFLEKLFQN